MYISVSNSVRYAISFLRLNTERVYITTPWRNGSASDSRSEGCVFKSRRGQRNFC